VSTSAYWLIGLLGPLAGLTLLSILSLLLLLLQYGFRKEDDDSPPWMRTLLVGHGYGTDAEQSARWPRLLAGALVGAVFFGLGNGVLAASIGAPLRVAAAAGCGAGDSRVSGSHGCGPEDRDQRHSYRRVG